MTNRRVRVGQFSAALVLLCGSLSVNAVPITFTDTSIFSSAGVYDSIDGSSDLDAFNRGDVNFLSTSLSQAEAYDFDYVAWTHHFDFSPPADYIISGNLSLSIRDDSDIYTAEFALGMAEDGTWGVGEVDTNTYDFDISTAFLADGEFSLVVASLLGDFYIDRSDLTITYMSLGEGVAVPEPKSLALLGLGLLLMGFVGRQINYTQH